MIHESHETLKYIVADCYDCICVAVCLSVCIYMV